MTLKPGDKDYQAILDYYKSLGGAGSEFPYQRGTWRVYNEDNYLYFVRLGPREGIDAHYESVSITHTGKS